MKRRILFLLLAALATLPLYAYDFEVDGIYYNKLSNGKCEVTYRYPSGGSYSGDIVIPESVTYNSIKWSVTIIGYSAFLCSNLTSVKIPNSVIKIGEKVFSNCYSLTSVTIPNSVTEIGEEAFSYCQRLTSVTIPNSVTYIGNSAFLCSDLTSVTIPNSVIKIGEKVFSNCYSLTSVTIPNSVTEIGEEAFSYCIGLTSLTLPNSVTYIGRWAFGGCSDLTEISVETDNRYFTSENGVLFNTDKSKLIAYPGGKTGDYSIPNSVTKIGDSAFLGCAGLTSVTIPNSVTELDPIAFYKCTRLVKIIVDTKNRYFASENGVLFNTDKSKLIAYPGGKTGDYSIPNSVTEIGDYAFLGCTGLTSVTIPNSVTEIDNFAFFDCNSLTEVTFNAENCYKCDLLSYSAFPTGIEKLTIGDKVRIIPNYAFRNCSCLTSIIIPNSVTKIGDSAFRGCDSLNEVTFNAENCSTCGSSSSPAFPSKIKKLTFGDSVNIIPDNAFYDCKSLSEITIPASVTTIGDCAFSECTGLSSLQIPKNVTTIGNGAFQECNNMKELFFDAENCTTCGSNDQPAFPSSVESIKLGEKVTHIPDYAFSRVSNLSRITIPNSVTSIGKSAFYSCEGLTMVSMGDYIESVGEDAFRGCSGLSKVKIENVNTWARINFANSNANPLNNSSTYRQVGLYVGDDSELASSVVIEGNKPVGTYAFAGALFLEQVRVKDGAPVGSNAFTDCENLKRICLNTPSLDNAAFSGCKALETIYSETAAAPSAPDNTFTKYNGVNLYVPRKCVSAYEDAPTCWYRFVAITAKDMNDLDEIFTPSYANNETPEIIPVSEILLNESSLSIEVGKSFQLTAEILPKNATNTELIWASSDSQCVEVDKNGLVTAIGEGEATITVSSADGHARATCMVTVITDAGIDEVRVDGKVEVYDLRGVKVGESLNGLPHGLYIVKTPTKTAKIAI